MRLSQDLQRLRTKREQVDRAREDAGGTSGDMSKNKDGVLLIPGSEAGACVCVELVPSPSSRCCSCSES